MYRMCDVIREEEEKKERNFRKNGSQAQNKDL